MGKLPAFVIAKFVRCVTRLRGGGSAFPGLVLLRLRPAVLRETLESLPRGIVFVTGSNGKSTTTTMITSVLRAHGLTVFSNPAGGNLPQGLASALVGAASLRGRLSADVAVLEVDEAYGGIIADSITPQWVVLTNLQVDQLNRFGEPENVYRMMRDLARRATVGVLVNSADPNLVALGAEIEAAGGRVENIDVSEDALASASHGVVPAPLHAELEASLTSEPVASLLHAEGSQASIALGEAEVSVSLPAPGLHYAVDATLALGVASVLVDGVLGHDVVAQALTDGASVYGRGETIAYRGAKLSLTMMKNLPSLQVNLDAMTDSPGLVWIAVDEGTPDPSWIYDVDLGPVDHVDVISGTKAWQWALFLEHRGIPYGEVIDDAARALIAVSDLAAQRDVVAQAIVNYEQMMVIRRLAGYKELEGTR